LHISTRLAEPIRRLRMPKPLPLAPVALALALAACNQAPKVTDNALVDVANAADVNGAAFNDAAPVIEEAGDSDTAAVAVVAVPKPAPGVSQEDSAPLVEASDIEDEIRSGQGIERIRYGDGWAWRRNGVIVRTADRDGRNTAYFRRGEDRPFFVQRDGRGFSYRGDRPVRSFDRDGRPERPDANRTHEAEEAARDARNRREQAERAEDRGDHRGGGRDHDRATPTPTPSASPTDEPRRRWREPQRRPDRQP
jgi:hypothetical protein